MRRRRRTGGPALVALLALVALALTLPAAASAATPSAAARSAGAFSDVAGRPPAAHNGARPDLQPRRSRALRLDRGALAAVLDDAPLERTAAARTSPLTISLPAPGGGFRRFAVQRSSVMEPALAARHPEISTYSGAGIDDRGATVHLDLTSLGLHAAVRGPGGSWYVDPYYHDDQSLYVSYRGADLANPHANPLEREPVARPSRRWPFAATPPAVDGPIVSLRSYRLALASDPAYATYHGAANVTSAKVTLINRVNQVYEQDLGIRLTLVANNDLLNFNTAAAMTGADGPCGAAACYTAAQAAGCDVDTLDRNRVVIGQLIGAGNYDVGHIGMGVNGGGVAYLGVVGDDNKAGGCTGVNQPVGDLFAVDYVAHELGHQFAGNHTFNGTESSCGDNIAGTAVEPGSGSTVMAYSGICDRDDLQPHSDPYFSQRTIDEATEYVGLAPAPVDEVQTVSLRAFSGTDSFRLTYNAAQSSTITRGTNYTAAAIAGAIKAIAGVPATATVLVRSWDGSSATVNDTGFSVEFGGALNGVDVAALTLTSPVGVTGFVGETAHGGPTRNGGTATPTTNRAPVVDAPAGFTIPARTPFSLTGSATDADGDTPTYLWEQNDAGIGTALVANTKPDGPLFRVFGTAAIVSAAGSLMSPSPGENAAGTSPTRTFPDLAQIAAGNTNAATGSCPAAPASPPVPAAAVDCYSEFLPTSAYANTLSFRLTARDGHAGGGGVGHDDTTLTLSKTSGPFRVTSQASPTTIQAGTPVTVTWSVAGTNTAPVSAANVRITLSTDGGLTFGKLVTPSTPNDGSQAVPLPNANTTQARIRVEALGNIFFDVNHANFTITPGAPVVANDAPVAGAAAQYSDALAASVAISATDENTQGSSLDATATGLPAGLSLVVGATSPGAGTPGNRAWSVGGTVTAAPGTYPVEVTVADGTGRAALSWFDVVVAPETASVTYTGDTSVPAGASATLRFHVLDAADAAAGDISTATVTFKDGATVLCAAVPVAASASATCAATLAPGNHHIDGVLGGRYSGAGAGDVQAGAVVPPPPPPPPPPVAPAAALLGPNLAGVASSRRISSRGRVSLVLRCRTLGSGSAPRTCAGSLKLTARIGGRKRTIGTASFSFARAARKTVSVKLTASARRAIRSARTATLTMTVRNAGGASRSATKRVRILPARRR